MSAVIEALAATVRACVAGTYGELTEREKEVLRVLCLRAKDEHDAMRVQLEAAERVIAAARIERGRFESPDDCPELNGSLAAYDAAYSSKEK